MLFFTASVSSYAQGSYLDCTPAGSLVETTGTTITELNGVSAFTFEAKIRISSIGAVFNIMNKLVSNTDRVALQINPSGLVTCCVSNGLTNGNGAYRNSTAVLQKDKWYHLAMVYDGTLSGNAKLALYIDGVAATLTNNTTVLPATTSSNTATFKVAGGGSLYGVDEVRVWNTALTQPSIDAWKAKDLDNSHPNYENLKLYWNFNDLDSPALVQDADEKLVDEIKYDGTITNALLTTYPDVVPDPDPVPDTSPYHPNVIAYLPYYSISKTTAGIFDHLTHLHYFSLGVNATGNLGRVGAAPGLVFTPLSAIPTVATDIETLKTWRGSRKTKIMVTLGGWVQSKHMDNMAATAATRATFIQEVKAFLIDNGLDGADIDWEGYDAGVSDVNYALLLSEMKAAFAGTGLEISVAIGPSHYSLADEFTANVDRIGLMSYGATFGNGMQVSLSQLQNWVNGWINAGAPKNKIIIGIPAFARTTADGTSLTQKYIIDTYDPANSVNSVVDNSKTYYFNGIDAVKMKCQYAEDNRLGGALLWDEGQDLAITHDKSVLRAMTDVLTIDAATLSTDNGDIMNQENKLSPIFPNPFDSEINVTVNLPENSDVLLSLYDLAGKMIKQISKKNDSAGSHTYNIRTESLSKGFYLLKITANGMVKSCKIIKG